VILRRVYIRAFLKIKGGLMRRKLPISTKICIDSLKIQTIEKAKGVCLQADKYNLIKNY